MLLSLMIAAAGSGSVGSSTPATEARPTAKPESTPDQADLVPTIEPFLARDYSDWSFCESVDAIYASRSAFRDQLGDVDRAAIQHITNAMFSAEFRSETGIDEADRWTLVRPESAMFRQVHFGAPMDREQVAAAEAQLPAIYASIEGECPQLRAVDAVVPSALDVLAALTSAEISAGRELLCRELTDTLPLWSSYRDLLADVVPGDDYTQEIRTAYDAFEVRLHETIALVEQPYAYVTSDTISPPHALWALARFESQNRHAAFERVPIPINTRNLEFDLTTVSNLFEFAERVCEITKPTLPAVPTGLRDAAYNPERNPVADDLFACRDTSQLLFVRNALRKSLTDLDRYDPTELRNANYLHERFRRLTDDGANGFEHWFRSEELHLWDALVEREQILHALLPRTMPPLLNGLDRAPEVTNLPDSHEARMDRLRELESDAAMAEQMMLELCDLVTPAVLDLGDAIPLYERLAE